MGKIYKLSDKNGNVLYPMTIGDAIAVDGATLSKKITTEATQTARGMMSAADKKKLDGIAEGATANTGTVTGVTIKAGDGIKINDQSAITTSGERTISLADSGVDASTYTSVKVDKYGRVTKGLNPTTLEGYGIEDAKIVDGTIILGENSITPLSDGSNYVTLNGNQNLTNKTYNGYTLRDACAKGVDEATIRPLSTNLPTSKAVAAYVDGALVSVLKYQGTVTSTSGLPATHKVGHVYVVAEAGTYAGQSCEVGDYIICKTAGTTANNSHWDVINGENQVSDNNPTLNWGTKSTVATVDGTDIHVTMPSNPAAGKADSATTLDGYGITDAKIVDGTITLGTATITPLTQHQDISGKQDKITASGILKGNGNGSVSAAVAGTDYLKPVTAVNTPTTSSTPTQIISEVTQTTSGQITVKKSSYTIATSVPSNAKFTDTTYNDVTTSVHGLMTPAMLTKLNGIEEGATKIVSTAVTTTEYNDSTILSIITGIPPRV